MKIPISLIKITEEIGNNMNLVQGPGGNISYKKNDSLYIKASGTKMSEVRFKNIFVKVNINEIISEIENKSYDPIKNNCKDDQFLKPSIETSLHALMPHPYVIHVHCVNTLSWVVQKNYQDKIANALGNINWITVPYVKPGIDLARAIKDRLNESHADVILLTNHGLIAGADSPEKASRIIKKISHKLSSLEEEKIPINITRLNQFLINKNYQLPKYEYVHQLAYSDFYSQIVSKGNLFPDQVVFLKSGFKIINNLNQFLDSSKFNFENLPIALIQNKGVLVPKYFRDSNEDTLLGLSKIILKIPKNASINYLTKKDENDLINWDLEKHRQKLNT